jgi:phage terminase large subunit
MQIDIDYNPTPKQWIFHTTTANEVLYGGAAGGGKSKAIVMDALSRCMNYPHTSAYLFRRTYSELEDTLIKEALASYPKEVGEYNVSRKEFRLINGSTIYFRHCASVQDMYNYSGAEIQWLYIDELTSFEYEIYTFLKTRLRVKKRLGGVVPIVRCASNPGNIGHGWVKNYFVDAGPYMELIEVKQWSETLKRAKTFTKQYIPALATDDPYITDDYIFELERKPKALRDALLFGHWDAFEGQVFVEWKDDPEHYADRLFTHVIDPIPIPDHWPRYMGFDHGYSRPWAASWFASGPDGTLYQYRELYGSTGPNKGDLRSPREIARAIIAAE